MVLDCLRALTIPSPWHLKTRANDGSSAGLPSELNLGAISPDLQCSARTFWCSFPRLISGIYFWDLFLRFISAISRYESDLDVSFCQGSRCISSDGLDEMKNCGDEKLTPSPPPHLRFPCRGSNVGGRIFVRAGSIK